MLEELDIEVQAQLDKLRRIGFKISYLDFHMAPGHFIHGSHQVIENLCDRNGIINNGIYGTKGGYYAPLPLFDEISEVDWAFEHVLKYAPSGQYVYVSHPSFDTEESRSCGLYNAYKRKADLEFATSVKTLRLCKQYRVKTLRYDEAEPMLVPID
jgi:hypothetical protein